MQTGATTVLKFLPSILRIAKTIYEITKRVTANKNQCKRLSERVKCIVDILQDDSIDKSDSPSMERALKNLKGTLKDSAKFIEKFADASIVSRFLHNSDHQETFEELTTRLSNNAIDLNLALNISAIFDQQQDVYDRRADLAEISSKLDEIASEMARQQNELLKQNKNMKDEFKRRFDSFKYSIRQDILKAERGVEAKETEEEFKLFLHIPYHDLICEKLIGQGGFADVYKGMWLSQHHQVAIKQIRMTDLTENVKQTVLHEIATMYKIRYNHVLGVLGACIEPNCYALVVEYMSLGSLFDVLKNNKHIQSWQDRWSIALQMTKGVNYLHSRSIVHCDIKSLNFLMDQAVDGYLVKISDFGLAKIRQETSRQTKERAEQVVSSGTLQWKAPELLKFGKPSKASDIYSLGITFWELATRSEPYEDLDEAVICQGIKSGERLDIPEDIPAAFTSIITSSWSQEPKKRPTAEELIKEITKMTSDTVEHSAPSNVLAATANVITPELSPNDPKSKLEDLISQFKLGSTVNLNDQQITDLDMPLIAEQAIVKKKCTSLWIERNQITLNGASVLADALYNNLTLSELWLFSNQISDTGVKYLSRALAANQTLRKLGLAANNITNAGAEYLATLLQTNYTITMLGLAKNKIGNQGVQSLAKVIAKQKSGLQTLTLDRNEFISDSSIESLIDMIKRSQSLQVLWINDCGMTNDGKRKLRDKTASKKEFKLVTTYEHSS
ncbi:unnamed protein product [Adineta ricciae]|uniref:Protein kinase domain-containing protein n=1 Tax=Adineta ricciae TaxID=249248 RepID=A0A815EBH4_ADIRI|nr:unnamed protein product [Adineta ricciae]CAF1309506.1 unnamed protein product [Adineta ricciae]